MQYLQKLASEKQTRMVYTATTELLCYNHFWNVPESQQKTYVRIETQINTRTKLSKCRKVWSTDISFTNFLFQFFFNI